MVTMLLTSCLLRIRSSGCCAVPAVAGSLGGRWPDSGGDAASQAAEAAGGYTTRTARTTTKRLAPRLAGRGTVGDFSRLLEQWKQGDAGAGDQVVALTYAELRRLAHGFVR